jgi:hypothetical protein
MGAGVGGIAGDSLDERLTHLQVSFLTGREWIVFSELKFL